MKTEKIVIKFTGDKTVRLRVNLFDDEREIDVDTILRIDQNRLQAEAVTFPVILNRLGMLNAEAENKVKEMQLDFEIWESKTKEKYRQDCNDEKIAKKMTQDDIKSKIYSSLFSSPIYKIKQTKLLEAQKERDLLATLFWNAKEKAKNINLLLSKADSNDLLLEDEGESINGIDIIVKDR